MPGPVQAPHPPIVIGTGGLGIHAVQIMEAAGAKVIGLDIDESKVYTNVHEYGNTGSASVPFALWEARRDGNVAPGDLVVGARFADTGHRLGGVGAGLFGVGHQAVQQVHRDHLVTIAD